MDEGAEVVVEEEEEVDRGEVGEEEGGVEVGEGGEEEEEVVEDRNNETIFTIIANYLI